MSGRRVTAGNGSPDRCAQPPPARRTLLVVWSQRSTVDYALARRAALTALATGRSSPSEVCDAGTYLRRAARYHGEATDQACPVCRTRDLVTVTYTYGDCFRSEVNGRARPSRELAALAQEFDEFSVYVVEVCQDCGWNHLVTSFVLGTGRVERRSRRRSARGGR